MFNSGGAILAEKDTSVFVIESTIKDSRTNDGYAGGAIFSWDAPRAAASVTIEDSFILDNTSPYAAINTIGWLIVRDSTISGNQGGGLSVGGPTDIFDSTIDSNSGALDGGAIRIGEDATVNMTGGHLINNNASNSVDDPADGGVVYNRGALFMTDVMVRFNNLSDPDAYGGDLQCWHGYPERRNSPRKPRPKKGRRLQRIWLSYHAQLDDERQQS